MNSLLSQGAKTLVTLLVNTFVENTHHGPCSSIGDGDECEQTLHVSLQQHVRSCTPIIVYSTDGPFRNVSNFQTILIFIIFELPHVGVEMHVPRLRHTPPSSSSSILYRNSYSKIESTIRSLCSSIRQEKTPWVYCSTREWRRKKWQEDNTTNYGDESCALDNLASERGYFVTTKKLQQGTWGRMRIATTVFQVSRGRAHREIPTDHMFRVVSCHV